MEKEKEYLTTDKGNNMGFINNSSSDRSSFPLIVGILLITSGIISILYMGFTIFSLDTLLGMTDMSQVYQINPAITEEQLLNMLSACFLILMVLGIFPILGGIFSLKKKMYGIVLVGGILGIFSVGPVFLSSLLCIIALILAVMSKKEYA